ncbi:MAG: YggS family pyridoxal phosphate-dependent enzyme [Pseudomonadota bacterium]
MTDTTIAQNIAKLRDRIRIAAQNCGRDPDSVTLLAVSKTRPPAAVRAAAAAGLHDIGENYLQEALKKVQALTSLNLRWHFIGPLQSNKTRDVATHFAWVHSVDRLKIAKRLNDQRPSSMPPLNVCLQVNISSETSKAGLAPADVAALARDVAALPRLCLRGLMAIPAPPDSGANERAPFAALRELQGSLLSEHPHLDTLSMGMSGDMEAAIAEGATIVRIGTDIFGPR